WSYGSRSTRTSMNRSTSSRPSPSCFSPRRSTAELRRCSLRDTPSLRRRRRPHRPTTRPCCSSSLRKEVPPRPDGRSDVTGG
ncbi:hypothetical protein INR49_031588, partial [Caranx melampygus]